MSWRAEKRWIKFCERIDSERSIFATWRSWRAIDTGFGLCTTDAIGSERRANENAGCRPNRNDVVSRQSHVRNGSQAEIQTETLPNLEVLALRIATCVKLAGHAFGRDHCWTKLEHNVIFNNILIPSGVILSLPRRFYPSINTAARIDRTGEGWTIV